MKIAALSATLAVASLFYARQQQFTTAEHAPVGVVGSLLGESPAPTAAHSVYKRALDSAQAVAGQVRAQEAERAAEDQ